MRTGQGRHVAMIASVLAAGGALAQPPLLQLPGTAGCVSDTGTGGACANGLALAGAHAVAVSPDGRHVYVTAPTDDAVAVFDRDPQTRTLTQKAGTSACISETGSGGSCVDHFGIDSPEEVAVSPDGRFVYVASFVSSSVTGFVRNKNTGALSPFVIAGGCVSDTGALCSGVGMALAGAAGLAMSPDGVNIYVASFHSNAVAVISREFSLGRLSQSVPCISETGSGGICADGKALESPFDVAVSPDGENVYVASYVSDAVAVFSRIAGAGGLSQHSGTAGCVSDTGTGGECADGVALDGPRSVTVSPDGKNVYAVTEGSDSLLIFDRNPGAGALTQKAGTAGCISDTGSGGLCADGRALDYPFDVVVSADGGSVYVTVGVSNALLVFDRNPATGELTQKPGKAGCISEDGTGGVCFDGRALSGARRLAVTDVGPSVYVASVGSSAVDVFDRLPPPYDIDGDGTSEPLTDALLLLRYGFGFRGATLITGAVDLVNCARCTAADIEAFIDSLLP